MALIYAYKQRSLTKDITILDGAGTVIVPTNSDKIRAIIGREGQLGTNLSGAKLVVNDNPPTTNGSVFEKNGPSPGVQRLRLCAEDLNFEPGVYTLFVEFFDAEDPDAGDPTGEWKNVSRQVFVLEGT